MKTFKQLVLWLGVFYAHQADTFVVTKFDSKTIANYYNHMRKTNGDEALNEFFRTNIPEYCHALRQSNVFQSADAPFGREHQTDTPPTVHHIPVNSLERETIQEIQLRKFKMKSQSQTLQVYSFTCVDLDGEPKWFITPDFIPGSAFLWEFELRSRNIFSAHKSVQSGIPVQLIAIIDQDAGDLQYRNSGADVLAETTAAMRSNRSDKICDLNNILQRRLCVIVGDAIRRFRRISPLYDGMWSPQYYENRSSNFYYLPEKREKACKPAAVSVDTDYSQWKSVSYEMLYCSVRVHGGGVKSFYLGLSESEPSEVILLEQEVYSEGNWSEIAGVHYVPLLNHLR